MRVRRRLLAIAALAFACHHGRDDAPPPVATSTTAARPAPGPGVHDHTPHHRGVVGMTGDIHLEAALTPGHALRLWVTDLWRRPIAPARVAGRVTIARDGGDVTFQLARAEEFLETALPAPVAVNLPVSVAVTVDGTPYEMDFLLPPGGATAGAAGVPLEGCVPIARAGAGTGRQPRCLIAFPRAITALAAWPGGTAVLVGGVDLGTSVWRLPAGTLVLGLEAPPLVVRGTEGERPHPEAPAALAVHPGGAEVVVALEARLLRYDLASGRIVRELAAPGGVLRAVAWSPDGAHLLVTALYDPAAHLVRAEDGHAVRRFVVEREAAAVAFAPEGRLAAVGGETGGVTLFTLAGDAPPRHLPAGNAPVQALAFAGDRLVGAGDDGVVRVWDVATGAPAGTTSAGTPLARLAVAPGGAAVASAGVDGRVRVHDTATGAVRETFAYHASQVLGLAWEGDVLASGDLDGRVVLWNAGDLVSPGRPRAGSGSAP